MWPKTFDERLTAWAHMRAQADDLDIDSALLTINQWWFKCPWRAYHLHWDDQKDWPDPWQLLNDNMFCGLARGLGIMYTIALLDRNDIDATLIQTDSDNLVLVNQEKYILNWDPDDVVNINPGYKNISRTLSLTEIKAKLI
jgi:hypothetical protein